MSLIKQFPERIDSFLKAANKFQLEMVMVGGGAVNFHGYQRHSADLDFWIDIREENMKRLLLTLRELNYKIEELPEKVRSGEQNISIKISPVFELELITNFNPGRKFSEVFIDSELVKKDDYHYNVISFNDLINSKIDSSKPKDKLDVEELQKIRLRKDR